MFCSDLSLGVVLDVVADFEGVVEVDVAHFGDVESLRDDRVKAVRQGKEEEDRLDGDAVPDFSNLRNDTHFRSMEF
jgi:hypothetical protein